MTIFGIDLTTVPWPMFILLVFMAAALFWYINVYLPTVEQLEEIREQNKNILTQINKQIVELSATIDDIQKNVYSHKTEENTISDIIHDIKLYTENLNDISIKFEEKELLVDNKITNLTKTINEIKDQSTKKKFL